MSDFEDIVRNIGREINKQISDNNKSISAKELTEIVTDSTEYRFGVVNCYPGVEGGECHKIAIFISLNAKKYVGSRRKKGHLTFSQALTEIVRHMQGRCPDKTYHAILITDNWQPDIYDAWRANLQQIKQNATVDVYILDSDNCNRIKT